MPFPFRDPVFALIAMLATGCWAWWITRSIRSQARSESGEKVVEYGPGIRALAGLGWVIAGATTLYSILDPPFPVWWRIVMPVSLLFIATCLHLEFFHTQIRYDDSGVHAESPWRRNRSIPWEDFQKVTDSDWHDAYLIDTATYGRLGLHRYMSGRESLVQELALRNVTVCRPDK